MVAKTLNDFYRDKDWLLFRLGVIDERIVREGDHAGLVICEHCGQPIIRQYDIIAHHIIELTERNYKDATISLNPENIMLVHHLCHNKIHNKLGSITKQVYVVWGSPFSGKSSYVESVREYGDLVIDMDSIWQCVSGCDRYIKPPRLTDIVFGVRNELIDMVRMRRGNWKNAYIIGGYPLIGERERLMKQLGAREIYIECSEIECLDRLASCNDNRSKNATEYRKYISDWWEKSQMGAPGI